MPLELPEGWRDQLPETIAKNGTLDGIETIDQLAEMVVSARARESNSIHIPSRDAGEDAQKAFLTDLQEKVPDLVYVGEGVDMNNLYDRMGRPESHTAYELPEIPDPLKDNFAGLTEAAHKLGITKGQMKGLSEQILGDFNDNKSRAVAAAEEIVGAVKSEYGEAFETKTAALGEFAKQVGFDAKLVEAVSEGAVGLDNMKALEKLQEGFKSPGPRIGDDQGDNEFTHLTPQQAELKIDEIMNNKDHPYWHGTAPGHSAAIQQMTELVRAADAGKPKTETEKFREALAGRE